MRLILADDHAVMRQGLRAQLEAKGLAEVVGEAENGDEAVALTRSHRPDVVIMDITMPHLNGIDAIRQIHSLDPTIHLMVLSMHDEHSIVTEALKAGCHAYVLKTGEFEEIIMALEAMTQGERYLSPKITHVVIDEFLHPTSAYPTGGFKTLTPRERQILQHTAEGLSVKEIAHTLHVSPKTVDATRRNVMQKTEEHSIAGLTKLAIREGLTSVEF
jgi:DNA-binding NarL/FixJ family response regulator